MAAKAKLKNVRKLTIDRRVWLRGEGGDASCLLRGSDNKMCCVGIYLKKCGLSDSELEYEQTADDVMSLEDYPEYWLLDEQMETDVAKLYEVNDTPKITPKVREKKIAKMFKELGNVDVKFVN